VVKGSDDERRSEQASLTPDVEAVLYGTWLVLAAVGIFVFWSGLWGASALLLILPLAIAIIRKVQNSLKLIEQRQNDVERHQK
jgi:hypothetical protein